MLIVVAPLSNSFHRNEQIEAISTKLPVDKADLEIFFPK